MYDTILDKILTSKQLAEQGVRQNIPYPFERLNEYLSGIDKGLAIGVLGGTGVGKCFGRNTKIRMYDCSLKDVQDIQVGDLVMGDDSTPRQVISTHNGYGELFKVNQKGGESYIVNKEHILCLRRNGKRVVKKITNKEGVRKEVFSSERIISYEEISVKDYINKSNKFKHVHKGYKTGLSFTSKSIEYNPYLLGVWLGDGTSKVSEITNTDKEILEAVKQICEESNLLFYKVKSRLYSWYIRSPKGWDNNFLKFLQNNDLINNKHIPQDYLYNSRENRLQILAGLIDTDGYFTGGGYSFSLKAGKLPYDICFLARSLGYYCSYSSCTLRMKRNDGSIYECEGIRLGIYGNNLSEIPCRVSYKKSPTSPRVSDCLSMGIEIESIGDGEYFGFETDGNHKFLLEDFTVVHNSKFVRFLVYHIYKFYKETGYKVRIPFFCMEDGKERVWQFVICHYLYELYGINITHKELLSRSRVLPDFVKDKLIEAREYFKEFESIVIFIDGITEPSKIVDKCKEFARKWGKVKPYVMNVEGVEIEQKTYISDIHVIAIFDNMSNVDRDDEDNSEQQAILNFCKKYMRLNLCGFLNWTCIMIMQLDFESERQSFTKGGDTIINKLEPSLASIGDSKRASRSFHLIFSLFAPSRFDLLRYPIPPPSNPHHYYDIGLLGNSFRSLRVIKSNDSDVGMRVPLYFNGVSEVYEELPQPNTDELREFYEKHRKRTNKPVIEKIKSQTVFEYDNTVEDDEVPF